MNRKYCTVVISAALVFSANILLAEAHQNASCDLPILARPYDCPAIDAIATLPRTLQENHVFFPAGGAVIDAKARKQLDLLSTMLRDPIMQGTCLRLVGHSDPIGPNDVNYALGQLRAQAVNDYLSSEMGSDAPPISVLSKGETSLLPDIAKLSLAHRRVAIEAKPCQDAEN